MRKLSDEEYDPDQDPTTTNGTSKEATASKAAANEDGGVATKEGESATVHTTTGEEATQHEATASSEAGRLLPQGLQSIEGEIPGEMMEGEEESRQPDAEENDAESDEAADKETVTEEKTGAEGEEKTTEDEAASDSNEMDDVPSSDGWLDDVTAQTGLEADNEDEFVEKVRTMQRDVRGFSELEQVLEEVPQAATLIHSLAQTEGEIDPVDFYMAAQDVEGIDVQAPSKAENPDEWADFKAQLRERQQKMKNRREARREQQQKAQAIREDFEQAFSSFKKRKGLEDEEAQAFKEEFARVFYGDAEEGKLPRMDVFDLAYDALRGRESDDESDDTPLEETEEYQQGYNQAIEDMKDGGADGLPDLKGAGPAGADDGGDRATAGPGPSMPSLLQPSGGGGMNHDAF